MSVGSAVRLAFSHVASHWWPLVVANVAWAAVAVLVAAVASAIPFGALLLPVLALPTAGVFRVTTRLARGASVSVGDAADAWVTDVATTIALGIGAVAVLGILAANILIGLASGSPLGWVMAILAGWALVLLWMFAWTVWPIVVDPARAGTPVGDRIRLAALVVLARPVRVAILGSALGAFLGASTVAVVPLAIVSVALAALVATYWVLPAADRLEDRLGSGRSSNAPEP